MIITTSFVILQIIVGADGVVGINYEHAPAEGPPITSLGDFILKNALVTSLNYTCRSWNNIIITTLGKTSLCLA